MLITEADENPDLGYFTIAFTVVALYLGASDTLSNTMRWLVMVLTEFPEVQEECYQEIQNSIKKDGEILKDSCHYLRLAIN